MIVDNSLKEAIDLIRTASSRLIEADQAGEAETFNALGIEFGSTAYTLYRRLNRPEFPVLIHPYLVYRRSKSCDYDFESFEFWSHADMIVGLCEFLNFARFDEEGIYGKIYSASCS